MATAVGRGEDDGVVAHLLDASEDQFLAPPQVVPYEVDGLHGRPRGSWSGWRNLDKIGHEQLTYRRRDEFAVVARGAP